MNTLQNNNNTQKAPTLLALFGAFAKIGALTFGGGYAMLPMLESEVVDRHSWATNSELLDYFAIGQCTPGLIAVNTATFVGCKTRGNIGGVVATAGVVAPSFVIILIIAAVLEHFLEYSIVKNAFAGVRVCVCVLILNAVIKLFKSNVKGALSILTCVVAFVIVALLGASPIIVVVGAAALGIGIGMVKK